MLVSTILGVGKAMLLLRALGRQWNSALLRAWYTVHLTGEREEGWEEGFSSASPLPKPKCSKFTEMSAGHAIHRRDAHKVRPGSSCSLLLQQRPAAKSVVCADTAARPPARPPLAPLRPAGGGGERGAGRRRHGQGRARAGGSPAFPLPSLFLCPVALSRALTVSVVRRPLAACLLALSLTPCRCPLFRCPPPLCRWRARPPPRSRRRSSAAHPLGPPRSPALAATAATW